MNKGIKYLLITLLVINIIGGLNYGLIGIFRYNLLLSVVKSNYIVNIIYILIGLCAWISIPVLFIILTEARKKQLIN